MAYCFVPGSTPEFGSPRAIFGYTGLDNGSPVFETLEAARAAALEDAAHEPKYQSAREAAAAELFREKPTWSVIARLLRSLAETHRECFTPSGLQFVAECCDGTPQRWDRVKEFLDPIAEETPIGGVTRGHVIGAAMYSGDHPYRMIFSILRGAIYIAPGPRKYWSPRRLRYRSSELLSELAFVLCDPDLPARYGFDLSDERLNEVHRQVYATL